MYNGNSFSTLFTASCYKLDKQLFRGAVKYFSLKMVQSPPLEKLARMPIGLWLLAFNKLRSEIAVSVCLMMIVTTI